MLDEDLLLMGFTSSTCRVRNEHFSLALTLRTIGCHCKNANPNKVGIWGIPCLAPSLQNVPLDRLLFEWQFKTFKILPKLN